MADQRRIEDYRKVLAVEGYSDLLFYAEALEHLGTHQDVFIQHFDGASHLMTKLETFLTPERLAEKESIGIIVDADDNPAGRLEAVTTLFKKLTGRDFAHGVWSPGQPNLSFFVAPDGLGTGEIETLAWSSWANDPDNAEPAKCIGNFLNCMDQQGRSPKSPDKGKVSALLAVAHDEDPRLGPGARSNVFSFDRPEFKPLLDFLRGL